MIYFNAAIVRKQICFNIVSCRIYNIETRVRDTESDERKRKGVSAPKTKRGKRDRMKDTPAAYVPKPYDMGYAISIVQGFGRARI